MLCVCAGRWQEHASSTNTAGSPGDGVGMQGLRDADLQAWRTAGYFPGPESACSQPRAVLGIKGSLPLSPSESEAMPACLAMGNSDHMGDTGMYNASSYCLQRHRHDAAECSCLHQAHEPG